MSRMDVGWNLTLVCVVSNLLLFRKKGLVNLTFEAGSNTNFWKFYGVCMPEDTDQTNIYFRQMNIVPLILEQLFNDSSSAS